MNATKVKRWAATVVVALPISIALAGCAAQPIDGLLRFCINFTSFILASIAVHAWERV